MTQPIDSLSITHEASQPKEIKPQPEFFLDTPQLIRIKAGGVFEERFWFDVLSTDMISLEFAIEISKSKETDPMVQAFMIMTMLIQAWNIPNSTGEIAEITRANIMKLPAQMITPLIQHVSQVRVDFLESLLAKPNPSNS